jgi:hypothetical protein
MPDPISRLQLAQQEIDRVLGSGYAQRHPELVAVVVQTAASDWAAARLAVAIERVAQGIVIVLFSALPLLPGTVQRPVQEAMRAQLSLL